MPYKPPYLGRYVFPRRRADGTFNVLFEVPKRLRPRDWPPSKPLPVNHRRTGDLERRPEEVAAIVAEAARLNAELDAARIDRPPAAPEILPGTIPHLITLWGGAKLLKALHLKFPHPDMPDPDSAADDAADDWKNYDERTRRNYRWGLRAILAWSLTNNHKPARLITPGAIKQFLALYDARQPGPDGQGGRAGRPRMKKEMRVVLGILFDIAVEERLIARDMHPVAALRVVRTPRHRRGKKREISQWTAALADEYAALARAPAEAGGMGWPGGSILIRAMWQTSADRSDVAAWNRRVHFVDDGLMPGFQYDRGKTGIASFTPISQDLAAEIRANAAVVIVTAPEGGGYDLPAEDGRLGWDLRRLRELAAARGLPDMVFDHLRHSAATDAWRAVKDPMKVKAITAHASPAMLEDVYIQLTRTDAIEVQRARGIIA